MAKKNPQREFQLNQEYIHKCLDAQLKFQKEWNAQYGDREDLLTKKICGDTLCNKERHKIRDELARSWNKRTLEEEALFNKLGFSMDDRPYLYNGPLTYTAAWAKEYKKRRPLSPRLILTPKNTMSKASHEKKSKEISEKYKPNIKICEICKKHFPAFRKNRKYCYNPMCSDMAHQKQKKEWRGRQRPAVGRRHCEICLKPLISKRSNVRTCPKGPCRMALSRKNRAA